MLKHLFISAACSWIGSLLGSSWSPQLLAFLLAREPPSWQFDLTSAAIGCGLGLLVALLIYGSRRRIASFRRTSALRLAQGREALSKGAKERYREQVIDAAEKSHLLWRYAPLSEMYVEPRLVLPYADPLSDRQQPGDPQDENGYRVCLYDLLHPSQTTITLSDALKQHSRLALLGVVGSGRTTLLAQMVQLFARREGWRLTCDEPQETDSQEIRARRNREQNRLPTWIGLDTLDFSLAEKEGHHPLLEPLVSSLADSLQGMTARSAALFVRNRIIAGECLLLLDNLDTLGDEVREQALDWLDKLVRTYPENIFVITGPAEGYDRAWKIGFAPLVLEGFRRQQVLQFVQHWESLREQLDMSVWEASVEAARQAFEQEAARARKRGQPPPEEFVPPDAPERPPSLMHVWRGAHQERVMPLDLALAALLWREQGEVPTTALMRYAQAVLTALERVADGPLAPSQWARVLSAGAWRMLTEGQSRAQWGELEDLATDLLFQVSTPPAQDENQEAQQEELRTACRRQARAALNQLVAEGDLVRSVGHGDVAFTHPTFGHYFAAQHAARSQLGDVLAARVRDPRWQSVLLFYSALAKITSLVRERLKGPDDVFRSDFFATVGYLTACPEVDGRIQGSMLTQLAQVLLEPNWPVLLRRRAAYAIARIQGQGVLHLFRQALRQADPCIRVLGVVGLAEMEEEGAVDGLFAALSDRHPLVRMEALCAFGAVGDERALDGLVQGLQDEDQVLRRTAAEMLAWVGTEGYDLLRDAAESDDMYIRRAAVYGLGMINEPWAASLIQELAAEDKEWFVRSAATEAMERARAEVPAVLPEPPRLQDREWLVAWAAERAMGVGTQAAALEALARAIEEGDWAIKLAAVEALRLCGDQEAVPLLHKFLADQEILVREAAYLALDEVVRRLGIRISVQRGN